jgi:hypothetical protein
MVKMVKPSALLALLFAGASLAATPLNAAVERRVRVRAITILLKMAQILITALENNHSASRAAPKGRHRPLPPLPGL